MTDERVGVSANIIAGDFKWWPCSTDFLEGTNVQSRSVAISFLQQTRTRSHFF